MGYILDTSKNSNMKKIIFKTILFCQFLFIMGCKDVYVFQNPYDPKTSPETWVPKNFIANQDSIFVNISWKQDVKNIDGFILEKPLANGNFEKIYFPMDESQLNYQDNIFDYFNPTTPYEFYIEYKISAYAGNNISSQNIVKARIVNIYEDQVFIPGFGVTDIEGNKYKTAVYKNGQEWMIENLNVSQYNDGSSIPNIQNNNQWTLYNYGKWSYYEHNNDYGNEFKKLYNWYAVNDPKNICPVGWHIPTNAEWENLINLIGPKNVAGDRMRIDRSNSSNFSALIGGSRNYSGVFYNINEHGYWWTATALNESNALSYYIFGDRIEKINISKANGYSVRCLKD